MIGRQGTTPGGRRRRRGACSGGGRARLEPREAWVGVGVGENGGPGL